MQRNLIKDVPERKGTLTESRLLELSSSERYVNQQWSNRWEYKMQKFPRSGSAVSNCQLCLRAHCQNDNEASIEKFNSRSREQKQTIIDLKERREC